MGDPKKGLIDKFRVERTDGTSAPGEKHHGCRYYVLDVDHDKFAVPAIEAYASACQQEYPLLAHDLRAVLLKQPAAPAAAPDRRAALIALLAKMDDEAFSWVALAMLPKAMMHGAGAQIWPDGLGGFKDRATIAQVQQEAAKYCGMAK